MSEHSAGEARVLDVDSEEASEGADAPSSATQPVSPPFDDVYDEYFSFVWRTARRLGVAPSSIDDIVQETFVVVHRRLPEPRSSSLRTFIYGVVANVVRNHRRSLRRKPGGDVDPELLEDNADRGPEAMAQREQAARILDRILQQLGEDEREVFVLVELEQLTSSEVADMIAINPNTVRSRLRIARERFEAALARERRKQ